MKSIDHSLFDIWKSYFELWDKLALKK